MRSVAFVAAVGTAAVLATYWFRRRGSVASSSHAQAHHGSAAHDHDEAQLEGGGAHEVGPRGGGVARMDLGLELRRNQISRHMTTCLKKSATFESVCTQEQIPSYNWSVDAECFNSSINLSIFSMKDNSVRIRTFENGVGETLSCGSASLCVASYILSKNNKLKVKSIGGELKFKNHIDGILMSGPTNYIYKGNMNE